MSKVIVEEERQFFSSQSPAAERKTIKHSTVTDKQNSINCSVKQH